MADEPGGNTPPTNQSGVTPQKGPEPEKKETDQNPLFPKAAGDVPVPKKPEEEVDPRIAEIRNDPGYQKFIKDAGTPEIAYKRWQDSSKEANRLTEEQEKLSQYQKGYDAVKRDFDIMAQVNPDLYQKVVDLFSGLEEGKVPQGNQPPNTPIKEEMSEEKMARIAELQTTLSEFKRDYQEVVTDDTDLKRIRKYAASKAGLEDRDGKPFTYRQALLAGLQYYHPEVVADQARMEALAGIERRNSASESANVPSGSVQRGRATPLTPQEKAVADQFGMTDEEYRRYQQ